MLQEGELLELFKALAVQVRDPFDLVSSDVAQSTFCLNQIFPGACHEYGDVASRSLRREMRSNNIWRLLVEVHLDLGDVVFQRVGQKETKTGPSQIRRVQPVCVELIESLLGFFDFALGANQADISGQIWRVEEGVPNVALLFHLSLNSDLTGVDLGLDLLYVVQNELAFFFS